MTDKLYPAIVSAIENQSTKLDLSYCSDLRYDEVETIVKKCPQLISLTIDFPFPDKMELLSTLPNLRELKITGETGMLQDDWHLLSKFDLNRLYVSDGTDMGENFFGYLKGLRNLSFLQIHSCEYILNEFVPLLVEVENLDTLEIINCPLSPELVNLGYLTTEECFKYFAEMKKLRSLTILNTFHISQKGVDYLAASNTLEELTFDPESVSENEFDGLATLKNLKKIKIRDLKINDSLMRQVADLKKLTYLSLSNCSNISKEGLSFIAPLLDLQELEIDFVTNYGINDMEVKSLAANKNLRKLSLSHCRLTNETFINWEPLIHLQSLCLTWVGLQNIPNLAFFRNLRELDLTGNKLVDEDLNYLAKLSHLEILNLSCCDNLTDQGILFLNKLNCLHTLDLHSCPKIEGMCFKEFNHILNLENLNLSGCINMTDKGVSEGVCSFKNLKFLDLSECVNITDQGLEKLPGLKKLTALNLSKTNKISNLSLPNICSLSNLFELNLLNKGIGNHWGVNFQNLEKLEILMIPSEVWSDAEIQKTSLDPRVVFSFRTR